MRNHRKNSRKKWSENALAKKERLRIEQVNAADARIIAEYEQIETAKTRSLKRAVRPTAREIHNELGRNIRHVKKLRRIGCGDDEIARALGLKENDPCLQK